MGADATAVTADPTGGMRPPAGFADLLARCAARPDRYTDTDAARLLAAGDELVWGAIAWLRCYRGDSRFLGDLAARVAAAGQLTPAQLRGVLNHLRAEGRQARARRSRAGGRLPDGGPRRQVRGQEPPAELLAELRGLLAELDGGLPGRSAARKLRRILGCYASDRP